MSTFRRIPSRFVRAATRTPRSARAGGLVALASLLAFAGPPPAHAQKTLLVPDDYETINAAVEASEWGDTVLVGPGIYKESVLLTDQKGDGLIIRSKSGPGETTIQYGDVVNENEAVVIFQRCSNSTQLIGFTIDGRGAARRGILCNSDSEPVLVDLVLDGSEYGIASHRGSSPWVEDVTAQNCAIAGIFVSGGSVDARRSRFVNGEKFGLYIGATSKPARIRDCSMIGNGQVGIQAVEGEFSASDCVIANNGDSGIIVQDTSPVLERLEIRGHPNIGVVMEVSSAQILDCTIEENGFGVVASIEGEPQILRNVFRNNAKNHLGIEGDANPLVGGSLENGNRFLGETELAVQSSSTADVDARYNFWDKPCIPKTLFEATVGKVLRRPWASGNLKRDFDDCEAARKYYQKWIDGQVDEEGNIIRKAS